MNTFFQKHRSTLFALTLIFVVRGSFADQYQIPSGSMEPTIAVGDRVLVSKLAYDLKLPFTGIRLVPTGEIERGDIVVFHNPVNDLRMIKRVIALPGDRVRVQNGFIQINGQPVPGSVDGARDFALNSNDEIIYEELWGNRHAQIKRIHSLARNEEYEFEVPVDSYFAMGDNRDNSLDSRSWGFVPRDKIQGKALGVIYNPGRMERVGQPL